MIKIPIEIGDIVRVGRFKNKRVKVKTIEYDEYGLPLINGRPLLNVRIEKLMQEPTQEKMIKLKDILKEIGEGTAKPYKYTRSTKYDNVFYKFRTDSNIDYVVTIDLFEEEMNVRFIAIDPSKEQATYQDETNKGEQFRVMATVVLAVKEELKKQPQITIVTFDPAKSFEDDDRRAKFYKAYVEKQIPGSKLTTSFTGEYKIELPKK